MTFSCRRFAVVNLIACISFLFSSPLFASDSVCATVKIEIQQKLTLERQAFDAHMRINNGLSGISLDNVGITVLFTDNNGNSIEASSDANSTTAKFFIRVDRMDNIADISGAGSIAPSTSADIHWLIIPAPGAADANPSGKLYYVGATLTYTIGGEQHVTEVSPDYVYVKPMPLLFLDYFLPVDVYGDDAFTPGIEPAIPFPLGVRVRNTGYGTAKNLSIESAQPKIVDNDQGLLVSFIINGCTVNGAAATQSLLAGFGDIAPNASGVAKWDMSCSLSGRFVDFSASYSHSDELGGALTSLLQGVTTHFLIKDVVVDIPGRDTVSDFLAKDGSSLRLYDSQNYDETVYDQSSLSSLQLIDQSGSVANYTMNVPVTAGYMYVKLPDPFQGAKVIKEVVRSDQKCLRSGNAWLSKTRNKSNNNQWEYFVNLFDGNTTDKYTFVFDTVATVPQPVLQAIPDRACAETARLTFIVEATCSDGTKPALSAVSLPAGAVFTDNGDGTGVFDWTPASGQSGRYEVTFTAAKGALKDTKRCVLTVFPEWDRDGDGMPDAWELRYFGTLERDGTGDYDADGVSDLQEYLNGTNPVTGRPPTVPGIIFPDGAEIASLAPVFSIANSTDVENDVIRYEFEVYADSSFASLVVSTNIAAADTVTSWASPVTFPNYAPYYWRVRATDGGEYSYWADGKFFISSGTVAPGAPRVSFPADDMMVDTISPILEVTNAANRDWDGMTYRFEIYADEAMTTPVTVSGGIAEGADGRTSWQTGSALSDHARYFWRAIVTDEHGETGVSAAAAFTVDLSNHAPAAPQVVSPLNGIKISSSAVSIIVTAGSDPENDAVSCSFELDRSDTFDSPSKIVSGPIAVADGVADWTAKGLKDLACYYLRVKASDGKADSAWTYGSFRTGMAEAAPAAPVCKNPGDRTWVETPTPLLAVHPVFDVFGDTVTYLFELYADSSLASSVANGETAKPQWKVSAALADKHWYYWRVRAKDADGTAGEWSEAYAFYLKDSGVAPQPGIVLVEPSRDTFTKSDVVLQWQAEDPDGSGIITLYYSTDTVIENGTEIAGGIAADAGNQYRWNTSAVAEGTYYVFAKITAGGYSAFSRSTYTVTVDRTCPSPHATPAGGICTAGQQVVLAANEPAEIYYTTDGSTPSAASTRYLDAVTVNDSLMLKFFALDRAGNASPAVTENYTVISDTAVDLHLTDYPEWSASSAFTWSWNEPSNISGIAGYCCSIDSGTETFTTGTSYTASSLADGKHRFSVRVQLATTPVSYSRPAVDYFGVDTVPPVLQSVTLNDGAPGTDNPVVAVRVVHNGDGGGSGIAKIEAAVDNGTFFVFNGENVTLPSTPGEHLVAVKVTDAAGLPSETKSAGIVLASSLNTVRGTTVTGRKATLKDLRSNLSAVAEVSESAFSFDNIPPGVYGLSVENDNAIAAYPGRISLYGGSIFDAGAVEPGVEVNGISGRVVPGVEGVPVAVGLNLGQDYFLELKRTVTVSDGSFAVGSVKSGGYLLQALPAASSGYGQSRENVTVAVGGTAGREISLIPAVALSGNVNAGNTLLQSLSDSCRRFSTYSDGSCNYSLGLSTGIHWLFAGNNYHYLEPMSVIVDAPAAMDLTLSPVPSPVDASITNGSSILGDDAETGIGKSYQVFYVSPLTVPYLVPASDEVIAGTYSFSVYADSSTGREFALCLLADNRDLDIHSVNRVPCENTAPFAYRITGKGGKIDGVIKFCGVQPAEKPLVFLVDAGNKVVGVCEGGCNGEYFFKNVPAGAGYKVRALIPGITAPNESGLFSLSEGEHLTGVNLNVGTIPQLAVTAYPLSFLLGASITVDLGWQDLPVDTDYQLVLRLEDTANGNKVEGTFAIDHFDPSGTLSALLPTSGTATPGNAYRLSFYCIGRDGGWNDVVASYHTDAAIRLQRDTTPPVLTVPANMTVEAASAGGTAVTLTATAVDDFDPVPLVTSDAPALFPLGVTTVTFMAVDASGNMATASMRVTVVDTTPPALTVPADITAEAMGARTTVSIGNASATDIFGVTVTNDAPADYALGVTTVNWKATDANGNETTKTQKVTIIDTKAPALVPPPDMNVEATGIRTPVAIGTATATDATAVTITNDAPVDFGLGTTTVTWRATDAFGNTSYGMQKITVSDTKLPVIAAPADVQAEAAGTRTPVAIGNATATDIFGATITNDAPADYPLGTTVVTWTAKDGNGNSATAIQKVTVADTTLPVLTIPADITVEATGLASVVSIGNASATDVFGVTVTNDAPASYPVGITPVTWKATDANGNVATAVQRITVRDTKAPELMIPADIRVEATGVRTQVYIGTATASDIFNVTIMNDAPADFGVGITTVTWKATDANGNIVTKIQKVTVVNTKPPELTVPANVQAEATGIRTPVNTGTATATDIFEFTITSDAPADYPLGATVVTWKATNVNGNTATGTQKVTVVDTTPPVLTLPADVSAEATGTRTPVSIGLATATDIFSVTITNNAPADYPAGETVVTWTAKDANGNTATGTQRVTVVDTLAPVLMAPADITVEATGEENSVSIGNAIASDVSTVTITNDAPATFKLGVTSVTWTATDASGNVTRIIQKVTVVDTIAPVLTVPADVQVEATGTRTAVVISTATATDIFSVTITNDAPADYPLGTTVVTWTAKDANGNSISKTQHVTVIDDTPPSLTVPANLVVEAAAVETPVNTGTAAAHDIFEVTITNDAPAAFKLGVTSITWTATDTSGNETKAIQKITVVDTTAPVLTVPVDVQAEATGARTVVIIGNATATDIFNVTITNDAPADYPLGTTVVTWTAADANGNSVTKTQKVTVINTKPPELTVPADVQAEATGIRTPVNIGTATATDSVEFTITSDAPADYPLGTTVVTWKATNINGYSATGTQKVTVVDTTVPVLTLPADIGVEATGIRTPANIGTATATDIFGITITNDAPADYPLGTTVVTWTAKDANGNKATGAQRVTIFDTMAPVLTEPADITVEATGKENIVAIGEATASDVSAVMVVNDAPATFKLGVTSVTWTATDANGNVTKAVQKITVVDTTAPTLTVPADVQAEATGKRTAVSIGNATATDIFGATITNDAPAGYPLGTTVVTWTAKDGNGNSVSKTQRVAVVDNTPPTLTVPADLVVEATAVETTVNIGNAVANDIFKVTITNDAPVSYHLGLTIVTWTAVDASGNKTTATQRIKVVDTTAPLLTVPKNVRVEAVGVQTPVKIGQARATDIFAVTVTNDAPAAYGVGTTVVTWKAVDTSGNTAIKTQRITVVDTTAPLLKAPANMTVEATALKTSVNIGRPRVSDIFVVTVTNDAPPAYRLGVTIVTWTATDANGNTSRAKQRITVVDTTAPKLVVPADRAVEATAVRTPIAIGKASATDIFKVVVVNNAPPAFGLGVTNVTWRATDANGNSVSKIQRIKVKDTTPPVLRVPPDMTVEATGRRTPVKIGRATAADIFPVRITNNAPDAFPLGTTVVTWTAVDANGNMVKGVQRITVVSTTRPVISVRLSPSVLWPPNGAMVNITAQVTVRDRVDPAPKVVLTSITSNERDNTIDIRGAEIGTADYRFQLRAECRSKENDRIYAVTYTVTNSFGKSSTAIGTVTVPHDRKPRIQ